MQLGKRRLLLVLPTLLILLAGCGGGEDGEQPLVVSAASSLSEAFAAYGEGVPGEERFSFAGSDQLAAQIRQGAGPDVYASANVTYPDELFDAGLVERPLVFARNRLVLAVPADAAISSIADLTDPDVDLVIGAEGVPAGDYTRDVLSRLPSEQAERILANVRSEESDVKGVVGKVRQGAADAGFVYSSDVAAAGPEVRAIELPGRLRPRVAYAIAVVAGAGEPQRAQRFIDGLLAGDGRSALADAGFLLP